MSGTAKKTIYLIRCDTSTDFKDLLPKMVALGFVFRDGRFTTYDQVILAHGWATETVVYAHPDCKRTLMSVYGDKLKLSDYNTIRITFKEFYKQGLYKV
jgi:hypothetical protein